MSTKLTLRIDAFLVQQAKNYAEEHKKSVSQIVGDYFSLLSAKLEPTRAPSRPLTRSLRGVMKNTSISKHDYHHYLDKKYL